VIKLNKTAIVYAQNDVDRKYTVPIKTDLKVRIAHLRARLATGTADRDELLARRHILWEATYELPERCQLEIDGIRWNPVAGTHGTFSGPAEVDRYKRCDAVRPGN
jgi:hypothetical protein